MGSVSTIADLRSDPERLLSGGPGQRELELLGSLRSMAAPPGAKLMVWNALGVQVIGSGVTAAATASPWASAFWRGALKVVLTSKAAVAVPVVMAMLGAGALRYQHTTTEHPPSPAANSALNVPVGGASTQSENAEANPQRANAEATPPAESPSRAMPFARPLPSRDPLREESALLERARAQLRAGRARDAQITLFRLQAQFPKGALTQEREVLLIETLAARGNSRTAVRDAQSFVAAHPESPHAIPLRRFIERPAGG